MSKLDEIAARAAAATPGPWRCVYNEYLGHTTIEDAADQVVAGYGGSLGDSLLIAAAPTDIAYLLRVARVCTWGEADCKSLPSGRHSCPCQDVRALKLVKP